MKNVMGRIVVVMMLAVAGCAVAPDAPTSSDEAEGQVDQAVSSSCLTACKIAELQCMQHCNQDPNGGDCGCTEAYLACRAGC